MSDYFVVIADEVIDRFSNSEVLLLCLRGVTFHSDQPKICETFFLIHNTFKEDQVDKLLEIGFYLCYKDTISIFQTAVHKHTTAQVQ